jgi:hypothetical protein
LCAYPTVGSDCFCLVGTGRDGDVAGRELYPPTSGLSVKKALTSILMWVPVRTGEWFGVEAEAAVPGDLMLPRAHPAWNG